MTSIYPNAIDGYAQLPLAVDKETPVDAASVNRIRSAVVNIEEELGVNPSGDFGSVAERLELFTSPDASDISYDNASTVLTAITVQGALDEIARPGLVETSTTYMIQDEDEVILVDASGGPIVIGLPDASGPSRYHHIKKVDTSNNIVTVTPVSGQSVDDSTSGIIINASYDTYTIINDETDAWHII